jgi:uncharacterized protein with von Willebrand factor type A (vWA) domain
MMERRIIEFAGLLRRHGIRVSTAETLDTFRAARIAGIGQRGQFKSALRATMVKRSSDVDVFDELFDLYFAGLQEAIKSLNRAAASGMTGAEFQEFLDQLAELMESMDPSLSDLARALVEQDAGTVEQLLRDVMNSDQVRQLDPRMVAPRATRMIADALGASGLAEEFERLLDAAREAGASEEQLERLKAYLDQRLKDLGDMIKSLLKIDKEQREDQEEREQERERLLDKSFYYLSPTEIRQMREAVSALARRLRNIMAIRRRHTKRGRLDVKATLRASMEYGGVPFHVRYEDKRKERPQVVILCDISDSVRNVSRFMLQFVHSLQDMYSRVRSYVFVADIAEVTRLFSDSDIQTAINEAINGNVVNVYAHSDFGRAFKKFHGEHLEAIDGRTTVIVLGDARNNYNTPNEWVLRDVQERARQVIWLNPENSSTWGFGDSEMARYAKHCDVVEECRNLRQLYKVVDRMIIGA